MTFKEAQNILFTKQVYVKKDGLDKVYEILEKLGNPQNCFKAVHVTGTNGKGSVCAAMESVLRHSGYKTGLFSSPHLVCVRERIMFCGQMIKEEEFAALFEKVFGIGDNISFFEILTCMAFLYFKEKGVDIAFIEVGIGGKYDTTNVLPPPELCVITSIGMDHSGYLGSSLAAIARQKAGIIKKGNICLYYSEDANIRGVIEEEALKAGGKVLPVEKEFKIESYDWASGSMTLVNPRGDEKIEYGIIGENQAVNASVALAGLKILAEKSFKNINKNSIRDGFKNIKLEGRFQIIEYGKKIFILDGCHNVKALEAFCETFQKSPFAEEDTVFVMGILDDKNYSSMLKAVSPCLKRIVFTRSDSPRAINPCALADEMAKLNFKTEVEVHDDFDAAFLSASKSRVVVVAGSFYLAGAALGLIKKSEARSLKKGNGNMAEYEKSRKGKKTGEK